MNGRMLPTGLLCEACGACGWNIVEVFPLNRFLSAEPILAPFGIPGGAFVPTPLPMPKFCEPGPL